MTTPTDRRINAAAVRLFTAKGTTRLTVSELAQEANVARGTLYRNVGSVEGLFDRVGGFEYVQECNFIINYTLLPIRVFE